VLSLLVEKVERILGEYASCCRFVKVSDFSFSYNVVAYVRSCGDERKLLIKAVYDISMVSKDEVVDMAVLSKVTSAVPLIVGVKEGEEKLREDTLYRKLGVPALSVLGFKKVMKGEPIRLVKDRGIVRAKVKGEELRRRREEQGLSLGDVAEMLKVSRKTVYEYERGTFEASERTARLLMKIFGEDVIESVDIEPKLDACRKYIENRKVATEDICRRFAITPEEAYKLERTHGKLVFACSESEKYMVISKRSLIEEAREVAQILEVDTLINGE
ncbi:MAG: helix-turn-helix domain-containing protein, partial [Crenarchaeota archaeon]|nr:helix-turn-helix domain-containing protein [Thermoproteota archaeon]